MTGFDEDDFSILNVKTLLVVTRAGDSEVADRLSFFDEMNSTPFSIQQVDFEQEQSREELRKAIFTFLNVIRVYTKRPGKPVEKTDPFTIPSGGTVQDLAYKIHHDLGESVKHARVWGSQTQDGQTVGIEHVLCEGDVVELHS